MANTGLNLGGEPLQRRREDDALAGAPWPVKAIVVIGVTGAIACYLVWFVTNDVRGYQQRTEPIINSHVEATKGVVETLKQIEGAHDRTSRRIEWILYQQCVQGARNRIEQLSCNPPGDR